MPRRRRVLLFQAVPTTGEVSPLTEALSHDHHRPADEEEEARDRPLAEPSRTAVPVRPEEGGGAEAAAAAVVETTSSVHLCSRYICLHSFFFLF